MNEIHIFNRNTLKQRRQQAAATISEHDFIIDLAADYIVERLGDIGKHYDTALDLGCHTGMLGEKLMQGGLVHNLISCDISEKMVAQAGGIKLVADEECLPFAEKTLDLVVSSMSMHWVNDLPGSLLQIRKCLKDGGAFIASMPGLNTLKELRHCLMEAEIEITGGTAPHVSPFADVKTLGHLLGRAGFHRPVADSETVHISYTNMRSLLVELKNMGERNTLIKRGNYLRRDVLELAAQKYHDLYDDGNGGIVATAEIITITGLAAKSNL